MGRTLAQIEKDGYVTEEEASSFMKTLALIDEAVNHKWPKEMSEAFDVFLKNYGWHIRLWIHPNDLIPYILKGEDVVDKYFIKKLRLATFRLRWQAVKRFPHRRKMINRAFLAHWQGNYWASIPLFLILSEGMFRELTGENLFAKNPKSKTASVAKKKQNIQITPLMSHIIDAVSNGDIIGLRFSNDEYLKYPNVLSRNKILHGADSNYGTKVNAYKAISQFEFVIESVHIAFTGREI
ncbi:MAG TPA: hypothetical protein VL088_07360 [Pedobacter sp.]|nr:hypothetical protein [Pedobacter sp.]